MAFQEQIPGNHCWGCGPRNEYGLNIKSHWDSEDDRQSVCLFEPRPFHMAGPRDVLNGGIIAAVLDCHCVCTAIAAAYRAEGRPIGSEPIIWYVTGTLQVRYLSPVRLPGPVVARARVEDVGERKTTLSCSLVADDTECARGEVIAVRVPALD